MDPSKNALFITALIVTISMCSLMVFAFLVIVRAQRQYHNKQLLVITTERDILQQERLRIAADLHDELGSLLTLTLRQLESCIDKRNNIDQLLSNAHANLQHIAGRMKDIVHDLNDKWVLTNGLNKSIQRFIGQYRHINQMEINFRYEVTVELSTIHTLHLYRMVQELVHNTIRHAHARQLTIIMLQRKRLLYFYYNDDGIGFDNTVHNLNGQGLKSLYHRTELLGGSYHLETEQGLGYLFKIPLHGKTKIRKHDK